MKTLKVKEVAGSGITNLVIGLCKKHKLVIKGTRGAPDAKEGAVTLIDIVINDSLTLEGGAYFLPIPLVMALNKLSFSTKKFTYTTGFSPKNPRILTLLVNEFSSGTLVP